ncbi:hypothetical protein HZA57_10235, partial [Candidatus Poribacteria bacterium]|nr:hypothetical protein [Candidatus Poribacteria bacterium]
VLPGTSVYVCSTLTNTGGVDIETHDIRDSRFGTKVTGLARTVAPGESFTYRVPDMRGDPGVAGTTFTNDVTWTAYDEFGVGTTQTDSATVNVTPPEISLSLTVGTESDECATSDEVTVVPGTTVYFCYTVTNTGDVTVTNHDLADTAIGPLFSGEAVTLGPGESHTFPSFVVRVPPTNSVVATNTFTNTATWTSRDAFGNSAEASDSATVNVLLPEISLDVTVGTDPTTCSMTDEITVLPGTTVYFCYTVTNTGMVTLTEHDLEDTLIGVFLDGLNVTLGPGESLSVPHFFPSGPSSSFFATETVTNEAVWTARDGFGHETEASDSATVNVVEPEIELSLTVGTDPTTCSMTDEVTVMPGTEVYFCFTVTNVGEVPVTSQDLEDTLGTASFSGLNLTLNPGDSFSYPFDPARSIVQPGSYFATNPVVNTATWTSRTEFGVETESSDSATVNVILPVLDLDVTVNTDPTTCGLEKEISVAAGTNVHYCYTVTNTGLTTLETHDLEDSEFGEIFAGVHLTLAPGEDFTTSRTMVIGTTTESDIEWTGYDQYGNAGSDQDTVIVNVIQPEIELTATVVEVSGAKGESLPCGTEDEITVAPNTTVAFCYTVRNTGEVPVSLHDLVDDLNGEILDDFPFTLNPGSSAFVSVDFVATETVTNEGTWTASDAFGNSAEASDETTVNVVAPSIDLDVTVGTDPTECSDQDEITVIAGTEVTYCYHVTNTGETDLNTHDLVDSELGTLLENFPLVLAAGDDAFVTATTVIGQTTTNDATWTATDLHGNEASNEGSATVNVIQPEIEMIMYVQPAAVRGDKCGSEHEITVFPNTAVDYCYYVINSGDAPVTMHDLVDSEYGTLLNDEPLTLEPGETTEFTITRNVLVDTVNTGTWTASDDFGNEAVATDTTTVNARVQFGFDSGAQGWTFETLPEFFSEPIGDDTPGDPGTLDITATSNTLQYGFWQSPTFEVVADGGTPASGTDHIVIGGDGPAGLNMFRARWRLFSDETNRVDVPQFRLRVTADNSQQADLIAVESLNGAEQSPLATPQDYELFFRPAGGSALMKFQYDLAAFDQRDAPDTKLSLDNVVIENVSQTLLETGRTEAEWDFESSADGWVTNGAAPVHTLANMFYDGDGERLALQAVDPSPNMFTFGYWGSPEGEADTRVFIEADRIYWAVFTVGTDQSDTDLVPTFRCRLNEKGFTAAQLTAIASTGPADNVPVAGSPKQYAVFFPPNAGGGRFLIASLDLLTAPSAEGTPDDATIYLENLTIFSAPLPD